MLAKVNYRLILKNLTITTVKSALLCTPGVSSDTIMNFEYDGISTASINVNNSVSNEQIVEVIKSASGSTDPSFSPYKATVVNRESISHTNKQ